MAKKIAYSYDLLGNIVLFKFPDSVKLLARKKQAKEFILRYPSVKTVIEKIGKFKGRLRKMTTRHLAGEKTKETLYRENNCLFRFNIDETYFSPRLSNERKELSGFVKKRDRVLVMFAGVAPLPIVVAKNSSPEKVYSVELNRKASDYAKQNVKLNKIEKIVEVIQGDVKKVVKEGGLVIGKKFVKERFDKIMMPRPQLKDSFLEQAFMVSKKGTEIYYYDFCLETETEKILDLVRIEAEKARKEIEIIRWKKAGGHLAPGKIRIRVDFVVKS